MRIDETKMRKRETRLCKRVAKMRKRETHLYKGVVKMRKRETHLCKRAAKMHKRETRLCKRAVKMCNCKTCEWLHKILCHLNKIKARAPPEDRGFN